MQAAVEEEERQAAAAADNATAKDAIASAEVSRKSIKSFSNETKDVRSDTDLANTDLDQSEALNEKNSPLTLQHESQPKDVKEQSHVVGYDSMSNLPVEFYHYYHGSNYDMGTLIEVSFLTSTIGICESFLILLYSDLLPDITLSFLYAYIWYNLLPFSLKLNIMEMFMVESVDIFSIIKIPYLYR